MSEQKPREFWIDHSQWYSKEEKEFNDRTCSIEEWNGKNLVQAIEYSAFKDLKKNSVPLDVVHKLVKALGACEQILATYQEISSGEFNSVMHHSGADQALKAFEQWQKEQK